MKTPYKQARKASKIFSVFNTYVSIVGILECGVLYGDADSNMVANDIIEICKQEQQRLLLKYDDILDAIRPNSTVQNSD